MFDRFNFAQIAAPEVLAASTAEQRATFAAALAWLRANVKGWGMAAHYLYEITPEREFPSLLIWRRELDEDGEEIESDRVLELEVARDGRCRWFCEGQFGEWGEWSSSAPLQAWIDAYGWMGYDARSLEFFTGEIVVSDTLVDGWRTGAAGVLGLVNGITGDNSTGWGGWRWDCSSGAPLLQPAEGAHFAYEVEAFREER